MTKEQFIQQIRNKDVIILQGIPGSGKSTLAKGIENYARHMTSTFSADDGMMFNGEYLFQPEKLDQCHRECLRKFLYYLEDTDLSNFTVGIVDNTNTTNLEIAPYMAAAKAYGRRCYVVFINVRMDVAQKRQIHGVPLKKLESMWHRIENSKRTMPSYWEHIEIGPE